MTNWYFTGDIVRDDFRWFHLGKIIKYEEGDNPFYIIKGYRYNGTNDFEILKTFKVPANSRPNTQEPDKDKLYNKRMAQREAMKILLGEPK